jgi:hypothetical protein
MMTKVAKSCWSRTPASRPTLSTISSTSPWCKAGSDRLKKRRPWVRLTWIRTRNILPGRGSGAELKQRQPAACELTSHIRSYKEYDNGRFCRHTASLRAADKETTVSSPFWTGHSSALERLERMTVLEQKCRNKGYRPKRRSKQAPQARSLVEASTEGLRKHLL